ncbi:heat-inducible transcriptional repressor HrcA [Companilactobacillus mishanensis]|uniref:Heat-inducible transcription repressor HrcA n=1 Tax=Companilactobacillus mishanensis TaxID=2486008 RepID=A0ABW9P540_9LACO|nr:heat-inducible transcriptional repressor HrcA [Companilactobacillus mishanensis]MQS44374.1 heat-inducible transcriptional repressor HrcA [Companilactobacillus mishanensis]MQS88615.1 heat-inducible transcriptional repressor HrcA [Companilactobacillus mishanensis]
MLSERQDAILREVVRIFTDTGQPVGSKTLMNALPFHVSSATIRNEMATLEEIGYLEKTHLSSGRIPSANGYRYYLDYLVQPSIVPQDIANQIDEDFGQTYHQLDDIIERSAKILSHLTSYTAITLGPESSKTLLTGFRIVPLNSHQIMAIIVTSDNNVESNIYTVDAELDSSLIEKFVRIVNDKLVGQPLPRVIEMLHNDIPMILSEYMYSSDGLVDMVDQLFRKADTEKYFVDGQLNLLNYADNSDLEGVQSLLSTINQSNDLKKLLDSDTADDGIRVRLGSEMGSDALKNYSIITANYDVGHHGKGVIALLGPTTMHYSQLIGLLGEFRTELAKRLIDYYSRYDDS